MRDNLPYEYLCSNGHSAGAPYELKACPVRPHGKPCTGEMRRVGRGSKPKAGEEVHT